MVQQATFREDGVTEFKRGDFQSFRATADIRVGNPVDKTIKVDQTIEFDGSVVIYNGEEFSKPNLKGAVDKGWLVPIEDTESSYVPEPADIRVGPADNAGAKREKRMRIETAVEDEQFVGTVAEATAKRKEGQKVAQNRRAARAQKRRKAASSKPRAKTQAPDPPSTRKKFPIELDAADQDAVPVAKIVSEAVKRPRVDDPNKARREVQRLDSTKGHSPVETERIETSGDVEEPITGDSVEDVLPEAISTGKPAPTVMAQDGSEIEWDMSRHWRSRLSDALRLAKEDRGAFNHVMAMETPKLKKHIRAAMAPKKPTQ